jgi:oligopeptidase A
MLRPRLGTHADAPLPMLDNPLLDLADPLPFDRIAASHVEPAFAHLLADARRALDAIAALDVPSTYDTVLGALERATARLELAQAVCEHLEQSATTPEFRAAWTAVQPMLGAFWSGVPLHAGLYAALTRFAATDEARGLDPVRGRNLEKLIAEFRRHGAQLDAEGKAALTAIDVELVQLTTKFSQNVLDATNAFELMIDDEARLEGLPLLAKQAARASAASQGKPGWRFTLHAPSYVPAMTYLDDAALREQLYRAYNERATSSAFDNRPVLERILELRRAKANLLGFADFADLVLADRMAKVGARAASFVSDLRARTIGAFERERAELKAFAGRPLAAWDVAYVAEKQRKARFDFDDEALRPYFPLETVLSGVFELLRRLYGVRFEPAAIPVWNAAVLPYRLLAEEGRHLATVYVDLFPRDDKAQGAWMAPLVTATPPSPHVAVVAGNFAPPIDGKPSLLSHREVETLFHELGHLMHQCLSEVPVRRLGGANVAWDFVELPSQIHENWTWERETLALIARHHETGEPLPDALFERLARARNHGAAAAQMRQLGFAEVDLQLHRQYTPARDGSAVALAHRVFAEHTIAAPHDDFAMIASFSHLFAAPVAYAAGYYSYKWAEVLDADAFGRFREEGLFSREVGDAFRRSILARGDSADPSELFRAFRGRDPDPTALLDRLGLTG